MPRTSTQLLALGLTLILPYLVVPITLEAQVFESNQLSYRVAPFLDGLQEPWSMAFLPSGDMLITEQPGRLRIVRSGTLQPDPVAGVPEVRYRGQGGLLDVALHPDFASNRWVYLSYSKANQDGTEGTTAVIRGRLEGDRLNDVEEIFEADAWSTSAGHYGSRLLFDEDGYLFITVGDRQASPALGEEHPAQDLSNHQGTINRIHDDGRIPQDNPFVGVAGAEPSIWTYGHRSPQGLTLNPATGDIWESEHGPQGGDELNLVLRGRNYGWPVIGYGVNYGGAPLHATREREGMEQPVQYFTPSIGTSGLTIYTGEQFPNWKGSVFMGALAHPQVARLPLVGDGSAQVGRPERPPLLWGFAPVRDVRQGPDGYLYLALDEPTESGFSRIVRLEAVEEN